MRKRERERESERVKGREEKKNKRPMTNYCGLCMAIQFVTKIHKLLFMLCFFFFFALWSNYMIFCSCPSKKKTPTLWHWVITLSLHGYHHHHHYHLVEQLAQNTQTTFTYGITAIQMASFFLFFLINWLTILASSLIEMRATNNNEYIW